MNTYSLAQKTCLITGASRGIGKAIALLFAANGANLILLSRNGEALEQLKNEIRSAEERAICDVLVCDLASEENLKEVVSLLANKFRPDILINNAGSFSIDRVTEIKDEAWHDTMQVHLTAAYRLTKAVAVHMISQNWGRIINISSVSAQGEEYALSYSAAKAGLLGLTKSLALELAKFGITANAICPGWVETEMTANQLQSKQWCDLHKINVEDSVDIAKFSVPQERFLQAHEVAHLVAFLCSQEAQAITGQGINICGGLSVL